MAATTRKVYKITIKLTNNDENDEKEFTINNMTQILLQHFADPSNGLHLDNPIFMLKDNYYIDNDVLKSIRGSKVDNKPFVFKDFSNRDPEQIVNEFYTPILSNND